MATRNAQPIAESYRNTGMPWTEAQVRQLRQLAKENTPTRVIGLKLGRTPRAVQSKASEEGISLAPPNRPTMTKTKSAARGARKGGRSAKKTGTRRR